MCTVNGRIPHSQDNFTSISGGVSAVVVYMIVPHELIDNCTEFNVCRMKDLANCTGIEGTSLPDHSIFKVALKPHFSDNNLNFSIGSVDIPEKQSEQANKIISEQYYKRYVTNEIPRNILCSEI